MEIVVRAAEERDEEALVAQFRALNVFEDAIARDRKTDRDGAVDSLADAWRQVGENSGCALVAECGGSVVGHLFLLFPLDGAFIRAELRRYAYISELFVRAEVRGRGVGTALLAEAERMARERGVARMKIGVLVGNDAAASLYRKVGFAPYADDLCKPLGPVG